MRYNWYEIINIIPKKISCGNGKNDKENKSCKPIAPIKEMKTKLTNKDPLNKLNG